ncbi:MAG TPA: hypothetical protein VKR57_08790 [Terriglobales bacterium]|nr:hypothetical protein [Terriglobales bacterium]
MKSTKKMMSWIGVVTMVCNVNSFAKEKPKAAVNTEVIRSLDWASDANNYPNLQVKAECFQRDAKHFTWHTSLFNSADGILEVRGKGTSVDIDPQASVDGGSIEVKGCNKPLVLKLEARTKGEKQHFEIAYTDGAVVAREKQAKNWGGFAMALAMAGTSAMGVQAANQAQFGATAALRNAAAVRADQLAAVQNAFAQSGSAQQGDDDQSDQSDDDSDQ